MTGIRIQDSIDMHLVILAWLAGVIPTRAFKESLVLWPHAVEA